MNRNGDIPRWVAVAGLLLSLFLALSALAMLAGCGDPCAGHGGVLNDNKGTITCADGTVV